ncbi:MAG: DNA/RNA non-specific endonuclease [Psychrobium sp.]|nr:DNA/RNA non-specific endonuclease [Psychrobium sp.]
MMVCSTASADILSVHCPAGCPSSLDKNDMVFGHLYALSNNPTTKFADWVAYEVSPVNFGASPGRVWKSDPLLDKSETLEQGDYKGANRSELQADRGHQAPLASFAGSKYWPELNYLSNITPQDKDLNQGAWKNLEDAVRKAVTYRKTLFVITGPIYDKEMPSLPKADESHKVPSAYFKIVYDRSGKAAAFVMQQSAKRKDNYCTSNKSLQDVQALLPFKLPALTSSSVIYQRLGC